jgi:hypothetical protein
MPGSASLRSTSILRRAAALPIADLLGDDQTRKVLIECLSPLIAKGADEKLAQPFSDMVSAQIAKMRGIAGANVAKITASEMRHFLSFLRLEVRIELGLSGSDDEASSPDLPSPHLAK